MSCVTKSLGRLLFITLLVSSTYLHITKPQAYTDSFLHHYEHLNECTGKHLSGVLVLPSADSINWSLWVQIYGAFQGFIALLILSGDRFGGFLLFIQLVISGSLKYCEICNFLQWESTRQLEFAQFLTMVGASLILMSCSSKKSCKQSCKKQPIKSN